VAQVLYIQSSIFGENGQSSQLAAYLIDEIKTKNPDAEIITRDVVADNLPHIDSNIAGAFFTPEADRNAEQQAIVERSDALIEELKAADSVIIGLPMYNFSVPSQLKAYFDQIARAGVTFKYTETGAQGLIANKPVYLMAARGGVHKGIDDNEITYVEQFLAFLGLTDTKTVYAEGLNMGEEQAAKAKAEAKEAIKALV
jgi:FMN-dependent NADH-azoreductase